MVFPRLHRSFLLAALSACLVGTVAPYALAQGTGWTIFGGPKNTKELRAFLDSGQPGQQDRYYLEVPRQPISVSEYYITYPEYYKGSFDVDRIEVRTRRNPKRNFKVGEALWDKESRQLRITVVDPIPADTVVEIVLSNVRNPRTGAMFFFNLSVLSPGDIPLPRPVGTWVITLS